MPLLSLGTLMAYLSYIGMFYHPIQVLTHFSNWMTGFVSAGQRVFEVLDATTTLDKQTETVRAPDMKGAIEFRNVTFGYDPHTPVIKNVSLKIEPGQFIAPHGLAVDSHGDIYVGEVSFAEYGRHQNPPREVRSFRKLVRRS